MDLQSLGHAAATFQRDPRLIASAIKVIQNQAEYTAGKPISGDVKPVFRLNGVAYFFSDEIAKAIGYLAQSEAEQLTKERTEL